MLVEYNLDELAVYTLRALGHFILKSLIYKIDEINNLIIVEI